MFSVTGDDIQQIITAICSERYQDEPELFDKKVTIREFFGGYNGTTMYPKNL